MNIKFFKKLSDFLLERTSLNVFAISIALILVFLIKIQNYNFQNNLTLNSARFLKSHTPYYPGLSNIADHEIFSEQYRSYKKILILGASAADSIGCDGSWDPPDNTRNPSRNVHIKCSITGHLNQVIADAKLNQKWRAFNLARNGASFLPMLYTYAKVIQEVRPDIVLFGETFAYYKSKNADAESLSTEQYNFLDGILSEDQTKKIWLSYRNTLSSAPTKTGWKIPAYNPLASSDSNANSLPTPSISIEDLFIQLLKRINALIIPNIEPLPVKLYPDRREFNEPINYGIFNDPDPKLQYFEGFALIGELQKKINGKLVICYMPQYDHRNNPNYINEIMYGKYGHFLSTHQIQSINLIDLPLAPIIETYDGNHQTKYGNKIIADKILSTLIETGLLK